jgi:hypothetical protein
VSRAIGGQRVATYLIRRACRRLPQDIRGERFREWAAELPAILDDPDIRLPALRTARALRFAAGTRTSARLLLRTGGRTSRPRLPRGVLLVSAAVAIWVAGSEVSDAYPLSGEWSYLYVAAGAVSETLAILAVVRAIRWLRLRFTHPRP